MKLSFCLITLNEELNLRRCLASCRDLADEIVILDSGSTDATAQIAAEFGARFEHQQWLGYVRQKNRAIELASHPWIFSLDADEELSPELREEVKALKTTKDDPEVDAFSVPRCVCYEGQWIRHGDWYPDRLIRCFRKHRARFEGAKVHERLVVEGGVRPWTGELHHYSFRDAADHWNRCKQYAQLWAESQEEQGRTASWAAPFLHAVFRWIRGYVLRGGFLDGHLGLRIANYSAHEVWLKYRTLRNLTKQPRRAPDR